MRTLLMCVLTVSVLLMGTTLMAAEEPAQAPTQAPTQKAEPVQAPTQKVKPVQAPTQKPTQCCKKPTQKPTQKGAKKRCRRERRC